MLWTMFIFFSCVFDIMAKIDYYFNSTTVQVESEKHVFGSVIDLKKIVVGLKE